MSRKKVIKDILQNKKKDIVKPIFGDLDGHFVADNDPLQPVFYLNNDSNEKQ